MRARIASAPTDAKGHGRFDDGLRDEVAAYVRERTSMGDSQQLIADELGIHARLVSRWLRGGRATVRAVEIATETRDEARPTGRRVVLRGGVEILGLELDEVIALARALS